MDWINPIRNKVRIRRRRIGPMDSTLVLVLDGDSIVGRILNTCCVLCGKLEISHLQDCDVTGDYDSHENL